MRIARAIELSPDQRAALEQWARGRSLPARVVERARVVLRAAAGEQDKAIAQDLGMTPKKVSRWRQALPDSAWPGSKKMRPDRGRKLEIGARLIQRVVEMTTRHKPPHATHWSTRTMAAAVGINGTAKIWEAVSGNELHSLNLSLNKGVPLLAFHSDRPWLAVASSRGDAISIWDAATAQKIKDIDCQPPEQLVTSLRRVPGASGPCGINGLAVDTTSGSLAATGNFGARLWTGPDWARVELSLTADLAMGGTALASGDRFWVRGPSVWDLSQRREAFNLSTHLYSPSPRSVFPGRLAQLSWRSWPAT